MHLPGEERRWQASKASLLGKAEHLLHLLLGNSALSIAASTELLSIGALSERAEQNVEHIKYSVKVQKNSKSLRFNAQYSISNRQSRALEVNVFF